MALNMMPGTIRSAFQNATMSQPSSALGGALSQIGKLNPQPMPVRTGGPAIYSPGNLPNRYGPMPVRTGGPAPYTPPQNIPGRYSAMPVSPNMGSMPTGGFMGGAPIQPQGYSGMPRYNDFSNQLAQAQMLRNPNLGVSFS